jgi:hypothetical protein
MKPSETSDWRWMIFGLTVGIVGFLNGHGASAAMLEGNFGQRRWLGLPARRLQPSCFMPGADVSDAATSVDADAAAEIKNCVSSPCVIAIDDTLAFTELRDACEAAGGVFHLFSTEVTCPAISIQLNNWPVCWESPEVNSACTVDAAVAEIENAIDVDDCVEVTTHTGTTDFSVSVPTDPPTSPPSLCEIESSGVDSARRDLDGQVVPDAQDCTSNPCVIDVESYQEYSAMLDACKAAGGSFHVFTVVLTCTSRTVRFNDYPECLVSEKKNSNCTIAFSEAYMEQLWDNENCTESATHTSTTEFSGPASSDPPASSPGSCEIQSSLVDAARSDLDSQVVPDAQDCASNPCVIDVGRYPEFSAMLDACNAAAGSFHMFSVVVTCTARTVRLNDYPECLVSEKMNSNCTISFSEAYMEKLWDNENCTESANHTSTTDFFPLNSCLIDSSSVDTARENLDDEVLGDDTVCNSTACVFDVDNYPEYDAMKDACRAASGAFHLFTVLQTCPDGTHEFNEYPECLVSDTENSGCSTGFAVDYMEYLWRYEGCTELITHISTTVFSGGSGPVPTDVPSSPPAFPTDPPAFPTDPPATLTDSPTQPIPEDAEECSLLSVDGVYDAAADLDSELGSYIEDCLSPPCIIDVDSTQAYVNLKNACREAKGAFHEYFFQVSCPWFTFEFNNYPACGVSEVNNTACDANLFADILEVGFDIENCTETATHTNTTDFGIQDDDPDTKAPTEAPVAMQTTPAPSTPPLAPTGGITGILSESSAFSTIAPKKSSRIGLALILAWACTKWI